ncbi:outer envelope membrane protein 7-like [Miscanthus floridulus]|uniref:outer envelope membrane protein 7-like n=1 Tax=Miscanthus floridulus TaxID=154761 RepID=UPI0034589DD9
MGAVVTAVIAIAAVVLGWITIEMACKPCLETGRRAMDRALDPNYDPDSPANATTGGGAPSTEPLLADLSASTAPPAKAI